MPLKFGHEVLTSVTCARVCLRVADDHGREAEGWGAMPLSVQWVWLSAIAVSKRLDHLKDFCRRLAHEWFRCDLAGHPLTLGFTFLERFLPRMLKEFNANRPNENTSALSSSAL